MSDKSVFVGTVNSFFLYMEAKSYDYTELREKYNLHMKVERYISEDEIPQSDWKYIRE